MVHPGWGEDELPPKPYKDAEEVAYHVRLRVGEFTKLRFGHDGAVGLPVRPDVVSFARHTLFKPETGYIRAGGYPLPEVKLDDDGTVRILWTVDDRHLEMWVPCQGVLLLERSSLTNGFYVAVTVRNEDDPGDFDDEVQRAFDWLGDEYDATFG